MNILLQWWMFRAVNISCVWWMELFYWVRGMLSMYNPWCSYSDPFSAHATKLGFNLICCSSCIYSFSCMVVWVFCVFLGWFVLSYC